MIDLDFLQRLIRAIDESSLDSVEIERGGTRIRLAKSPSGSVGVTGAAAPLPGPPAQQLPASPPSPSEPASAGTQANPVSAPPPNPRLVEVKSPMVGTFYRSPSPDSSAYVEVGKRVVEGDTLCIIEAMKLMNELESELSGTIAEVCVSNAEPVEYGQVLFLIDPS